MEPSYLQYCLAGFIGEELSSEPTYSFGFYGEVPRASPAFAERRA